MNYRVKANNMVENSLKKTYSLEKYCKNMRIMYIPIVVNVNFNKLDEIPIPSLPEGSVEAILNV